MLISYRSHYIFVHIPKTAGSSIRFALTKQARWYEPHRLNRLLRKSGIPLRVPYLPPELQKHPTADTIRKHLPQQVFAEFFKFAFVRNPWDQLASTYFYVLRHREHAQHAFVTSLSGFDDYVAFRTRHPSAPQKRFVTDDDGALLVDFLGRFEDLAEDFERVCGHLRIVARLPHLNAGGHRNYRDFYTDHTAALVEKAFREDIEFFGYTFDSGTFVPMHNPDRCRLAG
jgi:hypothetical protein